MMRLNFFLQAGGMVAATFFGFWLGHRQGPPARASGRPILYYVDPMNPAHTSTKPGIAPCGMKLEPVYADQTAASLPPANHSSDPPGTVRISQEKQQLIGVRVARAEKRPVKQTLRLLGKVAADETRVYRVVAASDGWITKTSPYATGSLVKKDEILATCYSPEILNASLALGVAMNTKDRFQFASGENANENRMQSNQLSQLNLNLKKYFYALRRLGMGDRQIEEMVHHKQYLENVDLIAPCDGLVLSRNLYLGQNFEKGTEFFRIADLSQVWILADLFEKESRYIHPGEEVRVSVPNLGKTFTARVSTALPQVDSLTRTLKLRLEVANPDYELKPDMFVDIAFPVDFPESLVVPREAVLDTGMRQLVFVERSEGAFEPRTVETGWSMGDQVQITQGLAAGERIAISGNFLLDSESRMKLAAAGMQPATAKDPVCGMTIELTEASAARRQSQYGGKTYHFCSDACKRRFDQSPNRYRANEGGKPSIAGTQAPLLNQPEDP